jgi:multiple sugar transport system ATP-binding protein
VATIEFRDVTKRYADGREAVKSASLRIADGELMILVGPSGCGKTTMLRMIAGLEEITEGDLLIDDEIVNDLSPKARDVAMVFQNYALYPHMTVRENIAFGLKFKGNVDRKTARRIVDDAARTLGLLEELDRKPSRLSGGQRQRVAMGRAMVRSPKAFLLDEPLSNLDAKLRVEMRSEISRLQRRLRTTMIFVTHDQTEAMTLGDRIAVMRDGVIIQVGTPQSIYERPNDIFVASFIGSPTMNFLPAEVVGDVLRLSIGDISLPKRYSEFVRGKEIGPDHLVCGIRSEDFHDAALIGNPDWQGARTTVRIELLEPLGAESLAYFGEPAAPSDAPRAEIVMDTAVGTETTQSVFSRQFVARLDRASKAREGGLLELAIDTSRIHLFDAASGERLGD